MFFFYWFIILNLIMLINEVIGLFIELANKFNPYFALFLDCSQPLVVVQILAWCYIIYYIFIINGMIFFCIIRAGKVMINIKEKFYIYKNKCKVYCSEKINTFYFVFIYWKYNFYFNSSLYLTILIGFMYIFGIFVYVSDVYIIQTLSCWEIDPRFLDEFGPCILYKERDTFQRFINDAEYDKYYMLTQNVPPYYEEFNTPLKRDTFHMVMYFYTSDPLINYEDIENAPVDVQHERLQYYYVMQKIFQQQFIETATFIAKNITAKNYHNLKDIENIKKFVLDFDVIDLWHWLAVLYSGEFKTPLNKFIFGYKFMDLCNLANLYVKGKLTKKEKQKYGLNNNFDYVCLLFEIIYRIMYDEGGLLPLFGDDRHMNGDIKKIWVDGTFFGRMEVERMRGIMRFSDYYADVLKNHIKLIMNDYIFTWWGSIPYMRPEPAWPCNIFNHRHKFHHQKFKKYLMDHFYADKQKRALDLFNEYLKAGKKTPSKSK